MAETHQHSQEEAIEEVWRAYLMGGLTQWTYRQRRLFSLLPANPNHARCKNCYAPFEGLGAPVVRVVWNKRPANFNPRFCNICEEFSKEHPGGAEVPMGMLFADIRGSTALAESMSPSEFRNIIDRFYRETTKVLVDCDALIDKLAGDEVAAFFFPGLAGEDYVKRTVDAAQELLRVTGHADPAGPWAPVGVGVHTGVAFFGAVGTSEGMMDMTALGDPVNTAARLASQAATGEIIVSEDAVAAAGIDAGGLEQRSLSLKGKESEVPVRVIRVGPA